MFPNLKCYHMFCLIRVNLALGNNFKRCVRLNEWQTSCLSACSASSLEWPQGPGTTSSPRNLSSLLLHDAPGQNPGSAGRQKRRASLSTVSGLRFSLLWWKNGGTNLQLTVLVHSQVSWFEVLQCIKVLIFLERHCSWTIIQDISRFL